MNTINKKAISTFVVALFLVSISASVIPVHAMPATYHVYAGQLIQPVIDAANAGDRIIVHEGTYSDEQLIIDKALTLKGYGAVLEYNEEPTIEMYDELDDGSVIGPLYFAIQVKADNVRITGFKISVTNVNYLSAVATSVCSGNVIDNNVIEAMVWGVAGLSSENVQVRNNRITATTPIFYTDTLDIAVISNIINSQALAGDRVIGINLPGSLSGAQLQGNQIQAADMGIVLGNVVGYFVGYPSDVNVRNNVIYCSGIGIAARDPSYVNIASNRIDCDNIGIQLQNPSNVEVKNNNIRCTNTGIDLSTPSDIAVKYNTIFSDSVAIHSSGPSSNLVISNNIIDAGEKGIDLEALGMTSPVVTGNIVNSDFWGISLWEASEAEVKYNLVNIRTNTESIPGGIMLYSSVDSRVARNIVTGDFISGILIAGSFNTIENNIVIGVYRTDPTWGDAQGIRLWLDTSGNIVKKNLILGVNIPIDDMSGDNIIIP